MTHQHTKAILAISTGGVTHGVENKAVEPYGSPRQPECAARQLLSSYPPLLPYPCLLPRSHRLPGQAQLGVDVNLLRGASCWCNNGDRRIAPGTVPVAGALPSKYA